MENTKIDITKILTVSEYARREGITTTRVYQRADEGKIKIIKIRDKQFVDLRNNSY